MIIDCHVHFVGDGSSETGCWLDLRTPWRWLMAVTMARGIGLPLATLRGGFDAAYLELLLERLRASSLERAVLLAQDEPYDERGGKIPGVATFHVPNDCVLRLARDHPEFIPAVSIHPARPDALDELERCLAAGARVLKLLPNCHNVDCSAPGYRSFWEMMARGKMVLLAHTGGESTLPVIAPAYESPEPLRLPLECGVTVIAAHAAGRNRPLGGHYTPRLLAMMRDHPNLYADNSALITLNRHNTLPELLTVQSRVVHGSDYPVPAIPWGPWLSGLYDLDAVAQLRSIENPLERDYQAKRLIGFSDATFTRLAGLLGLAG